MLRHDGLLVQEVQSAEAGNEVIDAARIAEDTHDRRGGHILHHTNGMTLWRLTRTNVAELRVVELTRSDELACLLNGCADTTQMRQTRNVIQAIQHLGHTVL